MFSVKGEQRGFSSPSPMRGSQQIKQAVRLHISHDEKRPSKAVTITNITPTRGMPLNESLITEVP